MRDAFGDPTTWWGNVLLVFDAYAVGIGVVTARTSRSYRSVRGGSQES